MSSWVWPSSVRLPISSRSKSAAPWKIGSAPKLRDEALQAQSAKIDVVSGATYTSEGYIQSLQAALDSVHAG